ncbi:MAG TPA: M14 family zinc carboxypeptidase [Vitreimonas sp.]|uniref:M14 family zinc carboxypeptidase n=1 Tax=Vitreimonas sp. TaxID=3069702 RepID=UPI002D2B8998|nr:M14 family zinc carboxypeptidase [Vitreimonas sp.]HYD88021.1 M14 family zinc carboxypeptidase [Vitreimonas sp.]
MNLKSALLALAAAAVATPALAQTPICESQGVTVSVDFPSGGRHTCRVAETGEVTLAVTPEGTPINGSPWYAFRLDAAAATELRVTLDYGEYEHRYSPKLTRDGATWRSVPRRDVIVADDERRASMNLRLEPGATFIAAQPIETPTAVHAWAQQVIVPRGFEAVEYGRSIDDRPLIAYRAGTGTDLVVAMTRQHPPETSGAVAFRNFVETIMADTPQANAFRARHRILLVPMPNPDGVMRGHWRWNNGGLDLNRDWRDFSQPETRALRDLIQSEAQNRRTVAFFDFHSTRRNVIYAPPLDADSPTIDLLPLLRQRLDAAVNPPLPWTFSHSETGQTSKRWALSELRAPGLTVELDDEATVATAGRIGRTVAETMFEYTSR